MPFDIFRTGSKLPGAVNDSTTAAEVRRSDLQQECFTTTPSQRLPQEQHFAYRPLEVVAYGDNRLWRSWIV